MPPSALENPYRGTISPYTVLNNWKLELLKDTKVVVLADAPMISEKERDALRKYVKDGGRLYMSGHSAPELAEDSLAVPLRA